MPTLPSLLVTLPYFTYNLYTLNIINAHFF
jgi:hypothetical protein